MKQRGPYRQTVNYTGQAFNCILLELTLVLLLALAGCEQNEMPNSVNTNIGGEKTWENLQAEVNQANNGNTIDLSSYAYPVPYGSQYIITVSKGMSLRLLGYPMLDFRTVSFVFEGDNSVIIEDLTLTYSADENSSKVLPFSTLHFQGGDNHLEIVGNNRIYMSLFEDIPGHGAAIGVPQDSTLIINGSGNLEAICAGGGGAGIGGGFNTVSGTITISGGHITALGGEAGAFRGSDVQQKGAAGIGGGSGADGGETIITGGLITACGNDGGAAVGGGYGGSGGFISISGGFVEAYSCYGGAAIGGGYGGSAGNINIEGGEVEVYSAMYESDQKYGSAIGSGYNGWGGTLSISGGKLSALSSCYPEQTAIGCSIFQLPAIYNWRAGSLEDISSEEGTYPGTAFSNSTTYDYVVIKTD